MLGPRCAEEVRIGITVLLASMCAQLVPTCFHLYYSTCRPSFEAIVKRLRELVGMEAGAAFEPLGLWAGSVSRLISGPTMNHHYPEGGEQGVVDEGARGGPAEREAASDAKVMAREASWRRSCMGTASQALPKKQELPQPSDPQES